jgi:hypothetical protein
LHLMFSQAYSTGGMCSVSAAEDDDPSEIQNRRIFVAEESFYFRRPYYLQDKPVLRIHDILVWIRIRIGIRVSMPLFTNGSGCCHFRHWPSRCQQKTNLKNCFCLLLFCMYIYIIFQR